MPPKKNEPPPPPIPEVETEVVLPEDVAAPQEPTFCLALAHLFGHGFLVQKPDKLCDDDRGDEAPVPIAFDPQAVLLERVKAPPATQDELLARRIMTVEREELQQQAKTPEGEEQPLAYALRVRLEKERLARGRAKSNAARRKAIAAAEAAKQATGEDEAGACEPEAETSGPQVDFVLLSAGYPANLDELRELAAEGLCSKEVVDVWAAVYLAGETVDSEGGQVDTEGLCDELPRKSLEPPELVLDFYKAIQAAAPGTELSGCTICTVRDSHQLAFPGEGTSQADAVQDAMLNVLSAEAVSRHGYCRWVNAAEKVSIPALSKERGEARLYHRLMSSVDASHHDVPFFLHCLTEQVGRTLGGEVQRYEDDLAMCSLMEYLGSACDGVVADDAALPNNTSPRRGAAREESRPLPPGDGEVLPYLDAVRCMHALAPGGSSAEVDGHRVADAVDKVLEQISAAGVKRSGLPRDALHSAPQREVFAYRLYPFAPEVSPVKLEQLMLHHAFEELLTKAQPERRGQWCFLDRTFRERIPRELVGRTLQAAVSGEAFMSTAHIPRHDALLVALHCRSPGGRVMWHSWRGDLFSDFVSDSWAGSLFPMPTYNDWSQVYGGRSGEAPQPRILLEGTDARALGYTGIFEKLATPPDGSTILVTRSDVGLSCSFPKPSNELLTATEKEAVDRAERKSALDDGASSVAYSVMPGKGVQAVEAKFRAARCDVPAARSSKLARVMKDGLTFGLLADRTFESWREAEAQRLAHDAAAAMAAAGATAGEAAAEGCEAAGALDVPASPFEGVTLGSFWLTLPGGARVSARVHHERVVSRPSFDASSLSEAGVLLTYTMAAGQVLQVLGGGAVCLSFPLALSEGAEARRGPAADAEVQNGFAPGCPDDVEVSRTVTPAGCLCRRLLSGRVEVYQEDGTVSVRNPTLAELKQSLRDVRGRPDGAARGAVETLERLVKVYEEQFSGPLREPPSESLKVAGLPGHWVVVRPDGGVFGRVPPMQEPESSGEPVSMPGGPAAEGEAAAADKGFVDGHALEELPSWQDLLGGEFVDGGRLLEYEIASVPAASQEDLMSKHRAVTNALGMSCFEDPQGMQRISVHADGTQITRTRRDEGGFGYDIDISKESCPHVRCEVLPDRQLLVVECADGALFEVVPAHGRHFREDGRADTTLHCRRGTVITACGDGEIQVHTRPDEQGGVYTAYVHEARLVLQGAAQDEGFEGSFELHADQTLTVPIPTDLSPEDLNQLASPRCGLSGVAFRWPTAEFSVPVVAPPPRLFVIYGDGEAEELLSEADGRRLLAEAAEDDLASIVEGPDMGERVSRTIFRKRLPDVPVVPPMGSLAVPEGFDGGGSSCYSVLEAMSKNQPGQASAVPVVEWRQLMEYPSLTEEMREMFKGSLKQYRGWEAAELSKYRFAMQGPDAGKGKKDAKGGKDKVKEKRDKGKKGGKKAMQIEVADESDVKPPEPAFVQDLKISTFQHHLQLLRMRAAAVKRPNGEECLQHALEQRAPKVGKATDGNGVATYTVKVAGIDFVCLAELPALLAAVREATKHAFASEAGVAPNDVQIALSGGSLIVEATIALPVELFGGELHRQLSGSETLGPTVAEAVAAVEGIGQVVTGNICAVNGGAGGQECAAEAETEVAGDPFDPGTASPTGEASASADEAMGIGSPAKARSREGSKTSKRQASDPPFSFAYFKSEMGLQFLMESGEMDVQGPVKVKGESRRELKKQPQAARTPWDPVLVGEEVAVEEETPHRQAHVYQDVANHVEDGPDNQQHNPYGYPMEQGGYQGLNANGYGGGYGYGYPGQPQEDQYYNPQEDEDYQMQNYHRGNASDERAHTPPGPHPSKKSSKWDHQGNLRPVKPTVSSAVIEINTDYLEVEGATDRRVRTSSIAHKKNARQAPSVQSVRKTGVHAAGRGTEKTAQDLLCDDGGPEEHWKLTSTMQGLGDSNQLVAVVPGACRFGPLCLGNVYRMYFFLRNLDVDTTGYIITSHSDGDFVQICHTPGEIVGDGSKIAGKIAPGMAKKVCVEIAAHTPKDNIQHLIQILVKAHKISVPVTARILDVEEYEKDDATEMAIHQRHIGRTRERGGQSNGKPPPVELVTDPEYCQQAFAAIDRRLKRRGVVPLPSIHGGGYPR